MATRVHVLKEVREDLGGGWKLCLQWCRYAYDQKAVDDNEYPSSETGYRFIWRKPNNHLQAARGQARIPSFAVMSMLMEKASNEGWGDFVGDAD